MPIGGGVSMSEDDLISDFSRPRRCSSGLATGSKMTQYLGVVVKSLYVTNLQDINK
jgi:hypothetical protein